MSVKLYFERLTRGMHAKLDTRYTTQNDIVNYSGDNGFSKSSYRNGTRTGFMDDAVKLSRNRVR